MTYNKFKDDLQNKGEPIELEVLELIKKNFDYNAYKKQGYCKDYDLIAPNANLTYEVKNSNDAVVYIPIEISYRGNLSGIETTKATYWVILAKNTFFFIKTERLKQLIKFKEVKSYNIDNQVVEIKHISIVELNQNSELKYMREICAN
jgi:hypothetical protein